MSELTIGWLINLLLATRIGRDHAKNTELIKSLFDAETSRFNSMFTSVATATVTLLAGFGTLLYTNITESHEVGSTSTVSSSTTTVLKNFSPVSMSSNEKLLLGALGLLIVVVAISLALNRVHNHQTERTYRKALAIYFYLSRYI